MDDEELFFEGEFSSLSLSHFRVGSKLCKTETPDGSPSQLSGQLSVSRRSQTCPGTGPLTLPHLYTEVSLFQDRKAGRHAVGTKPAFVDCEIG